MVFHTKTTLVLVSNKLENIIHTEKLLERAEELKKKCLQILDNPKAWEMKNEFQKRRTFRFHGCYLSFS
jgi:hypothetical protein